MNEDTESNYTEEEINNCINILKALSENADQLVAIPRDTQIELLKAAGALSKPDHAVLKQRKKAAARKKRQETVADERAARAATGIRSARENLVFSAPKQLTCDEMDNDKELVLNSPRNCYVCKKEYTRMHFFYDAMCPECAELNYYKRFQTADLRGQVAVITGSRLKIGYQATLMLLRAGAEVVATTRFPVDSAIRYSKEADFADWGHRLHVYGLDLRHTPSVELFCTHITDRFGRLDILINNAAQTVRRPPGFYQHLMDNELMPREALPEKVRSLLFDYESCLNRIEKFSHSSHSDDALVPVSWEARTPGLGMIESARLSQIPYAYEDNHEVEAVFPQGKLDVDLQQVDLRTTNSWRLKLGEIQTSEMLELQLINSVAPFVLCNRLVPLMKKENTGCKHIVNVSAMEGKFMRFKKGERHPHTNMAKAALNMLTHTSASELAEHGIYMNAVDTGWVTDEDPAQLAKKKQELHDFQPPLDIVDGAARVCDPLFDGINTGRHWCGMFLKDYFPIDW